MTATHRIHCRTCEYWNGLGEASGQCRRSAPRSTVAKAHQNDQMRAGWPHTASHDWCGEAKSKEASR